MARAPWINLLDGKNLGESIALSALDDVGIHEEPLGSNRGKDIDAYNLLAESPEGSYWCGNFVGYHYKKSGAQTPRFTGNCQGWMDWAISNGLFSQDPEVGSAILYSSLDKQRAEHMGIVVCLNPLFSIEGNTTLDGYSRNGEVVTLKYPKARGNILGYVKPKSK